ncbi:MAG: heavy-metal-associated domain-containing protein [Candidatus Marinimicrobia bacterium]|nr:heavy-metal-associated domain-containing protein [Candidatus Neomarinimicrobiota bacterium]
MKYIGALLLAGIVFTIVVEGTYSRQELVQVSIPLIPTPFAQPASVGSTLEAYNGIHSARLSKDDNRLEVTYDKARLSMDDLRHLISSLGYRTVPVEAVKSAM